MMCVIVIVTML